MTFIEFLTRSLVITWKLEHHIFASELLVYSGECVQLRRERRIELSLTLSLIQSLVVQYFDTALFIELHKVALDLFIFYSKSLTVTTTLTKHFGVHFLVKFTILNRMSENYSV